MSRFVKFLCIDFMYGLWRYYHKWILHRGKYPFVCGHRNPYDILTPRRLEKQINRCWEKQSS